MIMLHKCVAIGGQPATGKTTLVKDILKKFTYQNFKYGLLRATPTSTFAAK